ncbi:solute carrier family 45 member 3 [Sigmodon hispidus]
MAVTLFVAEEAVLVGPPEPAEGLFVPSISFRCCPCHPATARAIGLAWLSGIWVPTRLHQLCCRMSRSLCRLFVADLCSWIALMTFTLFYTDFMGDRLCQGVPRVWDSVPGCTESRRHYDESIRMGSLGLFLQCALSLLFSTVINRLMQQFGTRSVYLASVMTFPLAAGATCQSHSVVVVTASAALTGFTFSALQILPYTLASLYHPEKQPEAPFLNGHVGPGSSSLLGPQPTLYVAFACDVSMLMVVAPSLFMGSIVQLSHSVTASMVSAAGLGLITIYFTTQAVFDRNDLAKYSVYNAILPLLLLHGSFSGKLSLIALDWKLEGGGAIAGKMKPRGPQHCLYAESLTPTCSGKRLCLLLLCCPHGDTGL